MGHRSLGRAACSNRPQFSWEDYQDNIEKQTAVERCIEVIGEAARYISDEFKLRHPDIPWRAISQQRNVIAHGYFRLEHDRLWHVATVEAPRLAPLVSHLPPNPEPDAES